MHVVDLYRIVKSAMLIFIRTKVSKYYLLNRKTHHFYSKKNYFTCEILRVSQSEKKTVPLNHYSNKGLLLLRLPIQHSMLLYTYVCWSDAFTAKVCEKELIWFWHSVFTIGYISFNAKQYVTRYAIVSANYTKSIL